jgi:hypothetical protein
VVWRVFCRQGEEEEDDDEQEEDDGEAEPEIVDSGTPLSQLTID